MACPATRWHGDLGGESIDILELAFQCEKRYKIKVPINQIIDPDDFGPGGRLKPEAIAQLRQQFPSAGLEAVLGSDQKVSIQDLLTVGVLTDFVKQRVAAAGANQPTQV